MASYGEIIEDYDPARELIHTYFTDYFRNPTMTKIKDTDKHSMYLTKLYCLLNRECRYIITFTEKNLLPIESTEELKNINWVSFQTRTLKDQYNNIDPFGYEPIAEGPLLARINKIQTTKEASTYNCEDFPITVTLLHTEKNTPDTYQKSGTIINALETFQTIITFNSDPVETQTIVDPNMVNNRTIINNQIHMPHLPRRPIPPRHFHNQVRPPTQFLPQNNVGQINSNYYPGMQNQPRPSHTRNARNIMYTS